MIDVVFLLLIFFVCTANFQQPEEELPTRLSLPGAIETSAPLDPEIEDLEEIVVKVLWEGEVAWQINERKYRRLGEVRAVLEAIASRVKPDVPVILDVEGIVPMESVIDVYDVCRLAKLTNVRFAASPESLAAEGTP